MPFHWLIMRFLEDRNCSKYSKCLTTTALRTNGKYVPCYECNGGRKMSQKFYCPKCSTLFEDENPNWLFLKKITCPFCWVTWPVAVNRVIIQGYSSNETIQLGGDLNAKETHELD